MSCEDSVGWAKKGRLYRILRVALQLAKSFHEGPMITNFMNNQSINQSTSGKVPDHVATRSSSHRNFDQEEGDTIENISNFYRNTVWLRPTKEHSLL
jgi:hypothetical protein